MTNVIITTLEGSTAVIINGKNDGDVFVVNATTATANGPVYDLRQASRQQIKTIEKSTAVDLGAESESFLDSLIERVELPVRQRILSIMR